MTPHSTLTELLHAATASDIRADLPANVRQFAAADRQALGTKLLALLDLRGMLVHEPKHEGAEGEGD